MSERGEKAKIMGKKNKQDFRRTREGVGLGREGEDPEEAKYR